jgi:hypothetical protein
MDWHEAMREKEAYHLSRAKSMLEISCDARATAHAMLANYYRERAKEFEIRQGDSDPECEDTQEP